MSVHEKPRPPKAATSTAPPAATLPFKAIIFATWGGGLVSAILGFPLGRKDWALGAAVGALLSTVGLLGLKSALRRLLAPDVSGAKGFLMVQSVIRWFLALAVMFLLLKVSVACLMGSLVSYLWFLGVLALYGLRLVSAATPKVFGPDGPAN